MTIWTGKSGCHLHRSRERVRRRGDRKRIGNWGKPRPPNAESCYSPPGRGVAYGFEANENVWRTPKIRVGARRRGGRLGKMDGQTSLHRFQAQAKWERSAWSSSTGNGCTKVRSITRRGMCTAGSIWWWVRRRGPDGWCRVRRRWGSGFASARCARLRYAAVPTCECQSLAGASLSNKKRFLV